MNLTRSSKPICVLFAIVILLSSVFPLFVLSADSENKKPVISSLEELEGRNIGISSGSIFDEIAKEFIKNPNIMYYNSNTDAALALENDKVDAYITDEPIALSLMASHPTFKILTKVTNDDYGYIFKKDDEKSTKICNEFNEYVADCKASGAYDEMLNKWINGKESEQTIDYSDLTTGKNGVLRMATSSSSGPPFNYLKDGVVVGFELDLAANFCREYGYGIQIDDYDFSAILTAVQSGVDDFGCACITITDQRKESVLFSDTTYLGGTVVVINDTSSAVDNDGFVQKFKTSFNKTFIKENRWQLFLQGIVNTMEITVLSIVFGTVLGFVLYAFCKKGNKFANAIARVFMYLIQGLPIVVLLMILFYIVFGKTELDGTWVSVIAFSLTFGSSVFGMLKTGVGAIDFGQNEAAFALGFSSKRTFIRIILPQASRHFLPLFRSEVVAHIKATSIVGYIAVQDLTRMSDIVRNSTFEAFFPLIATAVIYFLLEGILVLAVKHIELFTDKKKRKPEKILKGIKTK